MHETAQAFFHLDDLTDQATCPAGILTLRGWALGKQGCPLVDLRVRLADTIYPGVHGFLRTDLASHFKTHEPHLPAGFEVTLSLPARRQELLFEACNIAGEWLPIGSITLNGVGSAASAPSFPPVTAVQPHEFARAMQTVLRRASQQSVAEAAASVASESPNPSVTRFPHHPFHGHLHEPALLEPALFGRLQIKGWLFHETMEIRRVTATVDLQAWQPLAHGGVLPYVEALFPQYANARACKISGRIDVPAQLPSPLSVRIYAELADGSWHLCHVQRTTVTDGEQEKKPFVRFDVLTFVRACVELRRAFIRSGMLVPADRLLWKAIRGVFQEFKSHAPRRTAIVTSEVARRMIASSPLPRSVTLVTHNLSYEGAPLFLLEYGRELSGKGVNLQIVSAAEGPLRAEYERLGAHVQVVDTSALKTAKNARELQAALQRLTQQVDVRPADLIVANTLSAYWGVHLAHLSARPSLFYIHESTTPTNFYLGHLSPSLLPVIEKTFELATHVSFLTEATRRYYRPLLTRPNHSLNPGWIDLQQTDRYLASNPRAELRHRLALDDSTRLVVNVGSVCNRKGQHIFARAVDLLWRRYPELANSAVFLMVGGRDTLFDQTIADLLTVLDRSNLRVVAETDTPLAYYGAADLFACSSYEESFPRVILEAMACRLPIVSTNVHGISEQVRDGLEALLVPPGNTHALCEGLASLLRQPELAATYSANARVRVAAEFDSARVMSRHLALACELADRKS
jgi:glycosyltransferase involved in cell wall biosynthesis